MGRSQVTVTVPIVGSFSSSYLRASFEPSMMVETVMVSSPEASRLA